MSEGWKMMERSDVVPRRKWPLDLSVSASRRTLRNRSWVSEQEPLGTYGRMHA